MENKDNAALIIVIIVAILFVLLFGSFGMISSSNSYGYGGMMNWMFGSGFGFMWLFGWLFMVLILVALILFIVWLVKQIQKPEHYQTEHKRVRR